MLNIFLPQLPAHTHPQVEGCCFFKLMIDAVDEMSGDGGLKKETLIYPMNRIAVVMDR